MPSIVDTSVKLFTSEMPGAPVVNGIAGSLVAMLDACLVTGFGLRTVVSLVVNAGVATVTLSSDEGNPWLAESVILIEGVTGALTALNGEQKITTATTTTLKFNTLAANGTAAGTITLKMAPAGWAKPFSGTNIAVFRSADPQSTGMYIRIDDTYAEAARVVGYESMTGASTGLNKFPSDSQIAGGGYWVKSAATSADRARWVLVADSQGFFTFNEYFSGAYPSESASYGGHLRYCGDLISLRPGGDPYAFSIGYQNSAGISNSTGSIDLPTDTQALPRSYAGLGSSVKGISIPYTGGGSNSGYDPTLGSFPSPVDGGLRFSRRYITESGSAHPRADMPGVLTIPQTGVGNFLTPRSILPGTGQLTGRQLMLVPTMSAYSSKFPVYSGSLAAIDVTGPWR